MTGETHLYFSLLLSDDSLNDSTSFLSLLFLSRSLFLSLFSIVIISFLFLVLLFISIFCVYQNCYIHYFQYFSLPSSNSIRKIRQNCFNIFCSFPLLSFSSFSIVIAL